MIQFVRIKRFAIQVHFTLKYAIYSIQINVKNHILKFRQRDKERAACYFVVHGIKCLQIRKYTVNNSFFAQENKREHKCKNGRYE